VPTYMVQQMSSGKHDVVTYYAGERTNPPSHEESTAFTAAAKKAYIDHLARKGDKITDAEVEAGNFRSSQGKPKDGNVEEIKG